jgi:hypothetical protein
MENNVSVCGELQTVAFDTALLRQTQKTRFSVLNAIYF